MSVMEDAFDAHWGEAWNRRQLSDSLISPATHYLLIAADGETPKSGEPAAGFLLSRCIAGEEEMLLVAVRREYQGRGLGSKLIERFCTAARERGASELFLEMRHNNPARSLYEANGFTPIGRRANYYTLKSREKADAITYSKKLPG
ncbi:GNAT family N-acetyltransferase [Altererythrobacter sp. HHU K3-1]|uniref:GNAT family N-acetyltransferase n=2 Tax=Qipengyuania atrilutea TaxID=2744473 RepID=A0A850GX86_9SPHN|nr:GNAT family N-acetyltransferase [Actirhodobacter atriluteus]